MKKIMLAVVLMTLLFSCSDDKNLNTVGSSDFQPFAFQNPYSNIWNANNPLDSIGYHHNEYVKNFVENRDSVDFNNFESSTSQIFSDFASSQYGLSISASEIEDFNTELYYMLDSLQDYHSTLGGYIAALFPGQVSPVITNIIRLMGTCSSTNDINNVVDSIKIIENIVHQAVHLSTNEKNLIFAMSSQAKFSLTYWGYAAFDTESEWNEWYEEEYPEEQPTWVNWVAAAAGDVIAVGVGVSNGDPFGEVVVRAGACSAWGFLAGDFAMAGDIVGVIGSVLGFLVSLFGG